MGRSLVGFVVGAQVRADNMPQLILGAAAIRGDVGEDVGNAAVAEDAVGDQHRALLPLVDVPAYVLGACNQHPLVGVHLQQHI